MKKFLTMILFLLLAVPLAIAQEVPGIAAYYSTTGLASGPWSPATGSGGTPVTGITFPGYGIYYSTTGSSSGPWAPCTASCFGGGGGGSTTIETNGVSNAVQTILNFITSSTNTAGLTITPFNPAATGNERLEITGTVNATSGGTGIDSHTSTGCPSVSSGTWSVGSCFTGTVTAIGVATANGVSGTSSGGATPNLTITLGAITPSTVNGLTLLANATGFSVSGGTTSKTLSISNSLTLAGTDATTMTFPATSTTVAGLGIAETFSAVQTISAANGLVLSAMTGTACLEEVSGVVTSTGSACGSGGGTPAYPLTITGGVSGGVVYGSSSTQLTVSPAGTANSLIKWGGAGVAPGTSLFTDNGTTGAYTGTGGVQAAQFVGTGTTPAAISLPAGTGSIPTLAANSAGFAAPTTGGTSYLFKLPATISGAGLIHAGATGTVDGVNESALTNSLIAIADLSATGTPSSTTFLRGDNTWATPAGTGTVTSVGFTGGLISVGTPTTTPAFTVAGTSGGIPYFASASTWASSAALTVNVLTKGGGAGAAPSNSSITDNATAVTTTDTGGYVAPVFVANGTTAGFFDLPQGTTSAAVAPCNTATSICFQAPTAVTSQLRVLAGTPATGFDLWTNSSGTMTETLIPSTGSGPNVQTALVTGAPTYTAGTNVTSCVQATGYTNSNERGEITIVGGTATTGTICTVNFSTTLAAAPGLCQVTQNGGTTLFSIGHGTPGTTSVTITAGATVATATLTVDYDCAP